MSSKMLALSGTAFLALVSAAHADMVFTPLATPVARVESGTADSILPPEFKAVIAARGAMPLENPSKLVSHYGYDADGPLSPAAGDKQTKEHNVEATKTEPDKNTYLVLEGQKGADANYDYGTHFVFQGHEAGQEVDGHDMGYITRINLDADEAHRVTLMAERDSAGVALSTIDGSTWYPQSQRLLFAGEEGKDGGIWQATVNYPSTVDNLTGIMGYGSYEGIQADKDGNLWIVEDAGGKTGEKAKHAKQPNSFVFRFVPKDKTDLLKGGRLDVLQVADVSGKPIVFNEGKMDDDIMSQGMMDMFAYGNVLNTKWIAIHDTDKDGTTPFDANALAKQAQGTPMKRPENGVFRPGTDFNEFYFTQTGDTNLETEAGEEHGGFGGVFKLTQANPSANEGTLAIVYRGYKGITGLDNLSFATADKLLVVEDSSDKVHVQRKFYDCGYVIDLTKDYAKEDDPARFLANGLDADAAVDTMLASEKDNGFQNSGNNEITGIHVSDGDETEAGILGAKIPTPFENGWRVFYTHQHGANETIEIVKQ
jgi:hypothetical protein